MEKDKENARTAAADSEGVRSSLLSSTSDAGQASSTGQRGKTMAEIWREIQHAQQLTNPNCNNGLRGHDLARTRKISSLDLQLADHGTRDVVTRKEEVQAGYKPGSTIIPTGAEGKGLRRRSTIREPPKKKTQTEKGDAAEGAAKFSTSAIYPARDTSVGSSGVGTEKGHDCRPSGRTGLEDGSMSIIIAQDQESSSLQEDTASKGKTLEFVRGDPDFCSKQKAKSENKNIMREFSRLHTSSRDEEGRTATAAAEGNGSPGSNSPNDDEPPAWKKKLIKIVSICCFSNSTNAP